jgi:hypothetical protein
MSERYQTCADRNVRAAYERFLANPLKRRILQIADVLERLLLRLRTARRARDWTVRKLR